MSTVLDDVRHLRGWRLAAVALPIAAVLVAVGIALPEPARQPGDVCAMGVLVARESMDDMDATKGAGAGPGPMTLADLSAVLKRVDFELLAEAAPPDLQDDIDLGRAYVADLTAATAAGDPAPVPTAADLAALKTVTSWYSERCQ